MRCANLPQYQRNGKKNLHNTMEEKRICSAAPSNETRIRCPCSSNQNPADLRSVSQTTSQPLTLKSDTQTILTALSTFSDDKIVGSSYN